MLHTIIKTINFFRSTIYENHIIIIQVTSYDNLKLSLK